MTSPENDGRPLSSNRVIRPIFPAKYDRRKVSRQVRSAKSTRSCTCDEKPCVCSPRSPKRKVLFGDLGLEVLDDDYDGGGAPPSPDVDEYESDRETEEELLELRERCNKYSFITPLTSPQALYAGACRKYHVEPCSHLLTPHGFNSPHLDVSNRSLGPGGAMAICVVLLDSLVVTSLRMAGNRIGERGVSYLCQMLLNNKHIINVDVSENDLGTVGAREFMAVLEENEYLRSLKLSGNGFNDNDMHFFMDGMQLNYWLTSLDLSHNHISEDGGIILGKIIGQNDSLQELNLSWNHLRMRGAVGVASGLQSNQNLRELNLAWNGFGDIGAKALSCAIGHHPSLKVLDLTCNRIGIEGVTDIANIFTTNESLTCLRLSQNPITTLGAVLLLDLINKNESCNINELTLNEIPVTYEFEAMLLDIQKSRVLKTQHGGYVLQDDVYGLQGRQKQTLLGDPYSLLMAFTSVRGLRLIDLFSSFDKDHDSRLSLQEMKAGIKAADIPISELQVEEMFSRLDKDGDGEVEFSELMKSHHQYQKRRRKMTHVAKARRGAFGIDLTFRSTPTTPSRSRQQSAARRPSQFRLQDRVGSPTMRDTIRPISPHKSLTSRRPSRPTTPLSRPGSTASSAGNRTGRRVSMDMGNDSKTFLTFPPLKVEDR